MLAVAMTLGASAQLTIGGTQPVYDNRTNTYLLTLPDTVFGSAYHADVVIDDGVSGVMIDGQDVINDVVFPVVKADTCYSFTFTRGGALTQSTIFFTYLPIMCITGTFSDSYVTAPVKMIFPDGQGTQLYTAKIKRAGASTNTQWVHKRNYHVKFIDDNGEKKDVSFFGFRSDNHWRLDAGTRDMIRFRNYAANGLWADFGTKPYYADKQPNARSYIRGSHVEVFMNNGYFGFYNFTEYMDRKQMKLKKYELIDTDEDDDSVQLHGMMWKSMSKTPQTLFSVVSIFPPDNTLDSWEGFELEYPEIDDVCPTDYSLLANAVNFVARSDDATFSSQVGEYFDLPVLADYYMFINVVFGIDNACTNMVWNCYDLNDDKKLTLAVWDLDATVGQHFSDENGYYHADVIQPENELEDVPTNMCGLKSNRLFMRLKTLPQFNRMVVNRYWQLRETILQPDSLVARYGAIYNRLENCGALGREASRWSDTGDIAHRFLVFDEEYEYLCDWLRRRIAYLDTHTFACLRGDVNNDGSVNISDVVMIINYLLSDNAPSSFNHVNADVDANDDISISDAIALINMLIDLK